MSLRSEKDDTYRLDRIEFDRLITTSKKKINLITKKKNNKIEKHVQTASGSRPPRFSVATWINSWSSHSTQSHSCRMVGFAARNGGDGWGGRPFVARTRSPVETARVNGFPRLVVIPQGIAEGNDTSHGRKP